MTWFVIIISVNFQLKQLSAKFLPITISYSCCSIPISSLVRPKQTQGRFSTRVRLVNEELSFVEEFRYLVHMTADCRDKDIKKQFRRQNAASNMLVRKFSFALIKAKIQLFKSYCYPIYGCALYEVKSPFIVTTFMMCQFMDV